MRSSDIKTLQITSVIFLAAILVVFIVVNGIYFFVGDDARFEPGGGFEKYRGMMELLYFWANIGLLVLNLLLVGAAVFTFFIVRDQLSTAQKQHWADIMLKLDERFSQTEFTQKWTEASLFMETVKDALRDAHPDMDVNVPSEELFVAVAAYMDDLDDEQRDGLRQAYVAVDFCETVGNLVDRGFVRFEDVESLFGGWVQGVYIIMEGQIQAVRNRNNDQRIYEHFSSLGRRCIDAKDKR